MAPISQAFKWLILLCIVVSSVAMGQNSDNSTAPEQTGQSANRNSSQKLKLQQEKSSAISSRQAAVIAKQHAGGKVLRVRASEGGHRIKMLLPSGKVTYIVVGNDGRIKHN